MAADYSQMELRILAHLSNDPILLDLMRQAGTSGDVFELIARTLLRNPTGPAAPVSVSTEERNRAKKVTYGAGPELITPCKCVA